MMTRRTYSLRMLSALGLAGHGFAASRPSPDFEIALPNGRTTKLSSYRGKVIAFSFVVTS